METGRYGLPDCAVCFQLFDFGSDVVLAFFRVRVFRNLGLVL